MRSKEDIEIKKVLAGINKNLDKKRWDCMVSGCYQRAINSHLLQRHGVLSNVVEKGHCYELREKDIFSWTKDTPPLEFKRCGIQDAISLHLFCNHHDREKNSCLLFLVFILFLQNENLIVTCVILSYEI